jgi:hypothetical protein
MVAMSALETWTDEKLCNDRIVPSTSLVVEATELINVGRHFTGHNRSGWTTKEILFRDLRWLREESDSDDEPMCLILTSYSATGRSTSEMWRLGTVSNSSSSIEGWPTDCNRSADMSSALDMDTQETPQSVLYRPRGG